MIIAVGGTKGGTGKSTVATNLAVMLAAAGKDVLLVDGDEQGTATDFTTMRNQAGEQGAGYTCIALKGRAIVTEIRRLAPKYDEIVIDVGAGDNASQRGALAVADVFAVPLAPRSFDVWTLDKVAEMVEEARVTNPELKAFAFLNRADAKGAENDAAAEIIRKQPAVKFLGVALGNRKSYAKAATAGLSVTELRPRDGKASEEITALMEKLGYAKSRRAKKAPAAEPPARAKKSG